MATTTGSGKYDVRVRIDQFSVPAEFETRFRGTAKEVTRWLGRDVAPGMLGRDIHVLCPDGTEVDRMDWLETRE